MKDNEDRVLKFGRFTLARVNSDRIEACLKFMRSENLDGVSIFPVTGYHASDVAFLADNPDIRGVVIPSAKGIDISAVHSLPQLKLFSMASIEQPLDMSVFHSI